MSTGILFHIGILARDFNQQMQAVRSYWTCNDDMLTSHARGA